MAKKKAKIELTPRPDERTAAPVRESWTRIESWLAEHLPVTLAALRPGVADAELEQFEAKIRQKLPSDVIESLKIHDGQRTRNADDPDLSIPGVLFGFRLIPLREGDYSVEWCWDQLAESQDSYDRASDDAAEECRSFPADSTRRAWGCRGWIPLQENASGNYLGIDLQPGSNGRVGQVISFGRDQNPQYVLAPSWAHFLEDIADELEGGNGVVEIEKLDPGDEEEGLEPEISFHLKGTPGGWFSNSYKEWSKSKLSKKWQKAKLAALVRPEDLALPVTGALADEATRLVLDFVSAMHAVELHFLARYSLRKFGITSISVDVREKDEEDDGLRVEWGMTFHRDAAPESPEQEFLMSHAPHEEKKRFLIGEFPLEDGIAAKKAVWNRFLSAREHEGAAGFSLYLAPAYAPDRIRVADVRQIADDHLFVVTEPTADGELFDRTFRYHLRREAGQWRLDQKVRVDDERPRKVSF